jgi:hypothetical protein
MPQLQTLLVAEPESSQYPPAPGSSWQRETETHRQQQQRHTQQQRQVEVEKELLVSLFALRLGRADTWWSHRRASAQ